MTCMYYYGFVGRSFISLVGLVCLYSYPEGFFVERACRVLQLYYITFVVLEVWWEGGSWMMCTSTPNLEFGNQSASFGSIPWTSPILCSSLLFSQESLQSSRFLTLLLVHKSYMTLKSHLRTCLFNSSEECSFNNTSSFFTLQFFLFIVSTNLSSTVNFGTVISICA